MYNLNGLIPSRFLSFVAHFAVIVTLLWGSQPSVMNCLPNDFTEQDFRSVHERVVIGLYIMLGMLAFEFVAFLSGVTMFHATSALLSICCHCGACVALTYFILDGWQCGWFWCCFVLGSVLPTFVDSCVVLNVIIKRKW